MIKVVTDTDANMPADVVRAYDIRAAAIQIIFGAEVLREDYEIDMQGTIERVRAGAPLPKTSQPPPGEFKAIYEELLAEDPTCTILSIHVSGGVSGTVNTALQTAALFPEADIRVFDSKAASTAQALMVRQAAVMAERGSSAETILAALEHMRETMQVYFAVSTLEYLARGGRIGGASRLMGEVLSIKPILTFTPGGTLDAYSRQRTWRRALARLVEMVKAEAHAPAGYALHLGVAHVACPEDGQAIYEELAGALTPQVALLSEVGPGLGVHIGPGALGVCWAFAPCV